MEKIYYAKKYTTAGFRVFPVKPNAKIPAITGWQAQATTNIEQVEAWWKSNPDFNIGVVAENNLIVLDVDVGHSDGANGFITLEQYEALPDTFYVSTPNGGKHYYFHSDSTDELTIRANIDKGLDIRAGGAGYVVGAGSTIDGIEYQLGKDDFTMAIAPDWLINAALKDYQKPTGSLPEPINGGETEVNFTHANIQTALNKLDPDLDYDDWVTVGMAIHSEFPGDDGLLIWDSWSSNGDKYEIGCCETKWKSFTSTGGVTLGSLHHLAGIIPEQEVTNLNLEDHNDAGIGENILTLHQESILYLTGTDEWCTWDNRAWVRNENGRRQVGTWLNETIDNMAIEAAKLFSSDPDKATNLMKWLSNSKNQSKREAILRYLKERVAMGNSLLDSNPNLLGINNGVLELDSNSFRPVHQQDLITRHLASDYLPGATCPNWLNFLNTVMEGDRKMIDYLQRLVGYWLTTEVYEQEIYFVYGEGGNGKSTFLDTIKALLGDYAVKIPSDAIMTSQFGRSNADSANIARIAGARIALTDEINGECKLDVGMVKALSGDDEITARFLHKNPFTFKSTAKLVMYGNDKPYGDFTDAGLWRRMRLIHFSHTVPEGKRDKHLLSKLKDELPGILNWALTGLEKWRTNGLQTPSRVTSDSEAYRGELDNVSRFVDAMVEEDNGNFTSTKVLRSGYEIWCDDNCEPPRRSTVFQRALKKHLTKLDDVESGSNGQARGYHGIKIRGYHIDF